MKSGIEKAAEVLHKLLKINNDRIECYQKAEEKTHELNLRTVFRSMADESKKNASALIREIIKSGGNTFGNSITKRGKAYRVWMGIKAIFTGNDRQSILNSCELGEDAAQAAYLDAISSNELTIGARQLVRNQQVALKSLYDIIMTFKAGHPVTLTQAF